MNRTLLKRFEHRFCHCALSTPLLPIHLLWINLVTDGLPAIFLAAEPSDGTVMTRPPRRRLERLADASFIRSMLLTGFLTASLAMAVFVWSVRTHGLPAARSDAFTVLVFAELLRSFGCRSASEPSWRVPFATNRLLYAVVGATIALQFWALEEGILSRFLQTEPLSWRHGLGLLLLSTIPALVMDLFKVWGNRRNSALRA